MNNLSHLKNKHGSYFLKLKITATLIFLIPLILSAKTGDLKKNFKEPPAHYSILPFWLWNGTLEKDKLLWQLNQFKENGIDGAFMHARAGIESSETPYFSKGWWDAMDVTIDWAANNNFFAYLYDEDKWPSGSAGGRTLQKNYNEFIKKGLRYRTMEIYGPHKINITEEGNIIGIFAAQIIGEGTIEASTIADITSLNGKTWDVPVGKWAIISFVQFNDPQEQIDYLDKNAVQAFIDVTHEEYYKRYGKYFGNVIPGVFFDEIFASSKQKSSLVWTDDFPSQFEKTKGYDLRMNLPLLIYTESETAKVFNNDYFDVFSQLYTDAWFKTYADWCEKHGIWVTGHTEEDYANYLTQGDYFKTMGQLQVPGTDNEYFRYGFPRIINWQKPKQISSVAHVYGRNRAMVEAMGGGGYIIPLEEYRYGFGMLGAYGINLFVPHLFHYEFETPATKADWPASWFYRNPYWKYFKLLADFGKRISYMGAQGKHVCDIAILNPLTSKWADGYSEKFSDKVFDELQGELLKNYRDFDLIDPSSLEQAQVTKDGLNINGESYKVLILPELKAVRKSSADKMAEFVNQGGMILSIASIPSFSPEDKEKSAAVLNTMNNLFGIEPNRVYRRIYNMNDARKQYFNVKEYPSGGKAVFTQYLWEIPDILDKYIEHDIFVKSSTSAGLKFYHRKEEQTDFYLLVNESRESGHFTVSLKNKGIPEIWDPETGETKVLSNYIVQNNRLEVGVELGSWKTIFLVLQPGELQPLNGLITATNLENLETQNTLNGIQITGWGNPQTRHKTELMQGDEKVEKSWNSDDKLNEITFGDTWDFTLTQHELDYKWSPEIKESETELPVMEFMWEPVYTEVIRIPTNDNIWKWVRMAEKFSKKIAAERHISGWNANRINYYNYTKKLYFPEVWFRKRITLDENPLKASIDITAGKEYELWINGKKAGAGDDYESAETYDLGSILQKGENLIEVHVKNSSGLLAESKIQTSNGKTIYLITDDSWEASTDRIGYSKAFVMSSPPLGKWGNMSKPGVAVQSPVRLWYRLVLPPGARYLMKPGLSQKYQVFVNRIQQKNSFKNGKMALTGLQKDGKDTLYFTFETNDLKSTLQQPLKVICQTVPFQTGLWEKSGLWWYSGRAVYKQKINIPASYFRDDVKLKLDAGAVYHFAEIWINGKLVKYFPWGPFETDVTGFVHAGENDISVVVSNLLANKALWDIPDDNLNLENPRWWHHGRPLQEPDKLNSGMLGPVRIIPLQKETIIIQTNTKVQ